MKFLREDVHVIDGGLAPEDWADPASASSAVELSFPTGFSAKAQAVLGYLEGSAFLFEYKDCLVVTDESLWLTEVLHGDPENGPLYDYPVGGPRWICDSWDELETSLEECYTDLVEDGIFAPVKEG